MLALQLKYFVRVIMASIYQFQKNCRKETWKSKWVLSHSVTVSVSVNIIDFVTIIIFIIFIIIEIINPFY